MSSVFVSYRRNDAPAHAGRIYDRLAERLGKDNVYRDLDSTVPGGDFGDVIEQRSRNATRSSRSLAATGCLRCARHAAHVASMVRETGCDARSPPRLHGTPA